MTDITVPNVGESVSEVTIATWFKKVGDAVKKDEAIVELETDKAAQELVAPEDGVLSEIVVAEGENAAVGALIARLSAGGAPAAKAPPTPKAKAEPAANGVSGGTAMNIDVPNVGESVSEVTVANWMKQPGEAVAKDEPLVELETDKAAQELVAPESGVLEKILIGVGETAKIGDTLAVLQVGASGGSSAAASAPVAAQTPTASTSGSGEPIVMPAAQRVIAEHNLDANLITGTGKDGRITKADAMKTIGIAKAAPAAAPAPAVKSACVCRGSARPLLGD